MALNVFALMKIMAIIIPGITNYIHKEYSLIVIFDNYYKLIMVKYILFE